MSDDKEKNPKGSRGHQVPAAVPASAGTVGTRILEVTEAVGGKSSLARACGVSPSVIGKWCRGQSEPTATDIAKIALAGGVTAHWLTTGDEPKDAVTMRDITHGRNAAVLFATRRSTVPKDVLPTLMEEAARYGLDADGLEARHGAEYPRPALVGDFVMVPRYDVAGSAGHGSIISSEQVVDYLAFKQDWVRNSLGVARKDLALISVKGDSMEPTLSDGDMILIDRSRGQVEDSGVYVIQHQGALLVKRVQRHLDGVFTVMSDNQKYSPEKVASSEGASLNVVGRVVWVGRRL